MKLSVLALDYDGTIARNDTLDDGVRTAIAEARTRGVTVILVTGRILDELSRVAESLHLVDAVVAENGAVVHFPDSGHTSMLAPHLPAAFVPALQARGIPHVAGRCLVDAATPDAHQLLEVIRELELPLVLIFNAGRVMAMAQGISKATGLARVLQMLRLPARNTVAIGDRENDHELLRLAEVGVAVEWGSAPLRAAADLVLRGPGPSAVGPYISGMVALGQLPTPPRARRRLHLGHTDDGRVFSLAVRGRNVLVAGDPKSGKSWVAGLLCEQLILLGYSVCVLDPEGDYRSLEQLPGVTVLGGRDPLPTPRDLLQALRYPDRSLVIDLSHQTRDDKIQFIRATLPALKTLRRQTGLPHRILLDEAHYFLHDDSAADLLDLDLNGYTIVTYCASRLPAALLAASEVILVTCESNPIEAAALRDRCGGCGTVDESAWSMLGHLKVGQAVALPVTREAGGHLQMLTLAPRMTPHVRHREKYVDMPIGDDKAFVFGAALQHRRVRTLRQFVDVLTRGPGTAVQDHLRRSDFSRWIRDVFGDRALADELRVLEDRYQRTARADTVNDVVEAIRGRYDLQT